MMNRHRQWVMLCMWNTQMPKKAENPFDMGYDPELDARPELDPDTAYYYLTCIGLLWWMSKLGRIGITTNVSIFLSYVALSREGILKYQYMSWPISVRGIIPDWCMILHTQKLITVYLRNVIGQNMAFIKLVYTLQKLCSRMRKDPTLQDEMKCLHHAIPLKHVRKKRKFIT